MENPEVYIPVAGAIISSLVTAIVALWVANNKAHKEHKNDLKDLIKQSIESNKDLKTAVENSNAVVKQNSEVISKLPDTIHDKIKLAIRGDKNHDT